MILNLNDQNLLKSNNTLHIHNLLNLFYKYLVKIIETQKNEKEINHNGVSFNEEDIITQNRLKMAQKMGAMNSNKLKKNKE